MKNPTVKPVEQQIKPESETQTAGTAEIETKKLVSIVHKGFKTADERQKMVQYAYSLGGLDFVTLIECENGNWNIHAVGDGGKAFGLCQINTNYHRLPENFKTDWRVQIEECYRKWKNHTVFYGPSRLVNGVKCYKYVQSRFTIIE